MEKTLSNILSPRKALKKAYLKEKPGRNEIEFFKSNLIHLLDQINESEYEEFHKNIISRFLNDTWYKDKHYINTKGKNDLVIHNDKTADSKVGVILETKSPVNKSEMLQKDKLNTKAFRELLLYYLREYITNNNLDIKHLVATNIYEWFIFDAHQFEKYFAKNSELVKQFKDFEEGRMSGKTTDFFYTKIAAPAIDKVLEDISFTHFDIRNFEEWLRNDIPKDDNHLIVLYKLLSPEHLLKLPFKNDSNSLDKDFYSELLHIIGLSEVKSGNKKLIERKKENERHYGSFLENAIIQLDTMDKISRINQPSRFGDTKDERLFNLALELVITWINRILFTKLLEAQLISYHHGDRSYAFLNKEKLNTYDDVNSLFFSVLAKKFEERNEFVKEEFASIPYLNSSLFEPTETEQDTLIISNLRNDRKIPLYSSTVLKDDRGKRLTGEMNTLEYLLAFLDAYDFSSEGSEEIQEENKSLINASVLGLIFEKINGYKDGSFFTPGFITMYMSRETIRRAVVEKFNFHVSTLGNTHIRGDNPLNDYDDLKDRLQINREARQWANDVINSLKICDPAVGSGHFLVSALNEIIAIKSDLGILQNRDGNHIARYGALVENDELIITNFENGDLFEYKVKINNGRIHVIPEIQKLQETLFHEKQTIIENCLFGVDINPNSVKICRLRLWIELLKNAYYRIPEAGVLSKGQLPELETLPNIDINIKEGNSLISRFALDADLKQALRKSKGKWTIDIYRMAVQNYRNAQNKEEKRELVRLIEDIKTNFRTEINLNDSRRKKLDRLRNEQFEKYQSQKVFTEEPSEAIKKDRKRLEQQIEKLTDELENIKNNKIYENAFEWRFEFPEVLNDDGDFLGFDVVIGNPPYVQLQKEGGKLAKMFMDAGYQTFTSTGDIYMLFYEKGFQILNKRGILTYITSNKWMRAGYGEKLRKYLSTQTQPIKLIDLGAQVFETATVDTNILMAGNVKPVGENSVEALVVNNQSRADHQKSFEGPFVILNKLDESGWVVLPPEAMKIKQKVEEQGIPLKEWDINIFRGILTGFNEAFVVDGKTKDRLISEDPKSKEILKPMLRGRDVKRYYPEFHDLWLIGTHNGYKVNGKTIPPVNIEDYPAIKEHLDKYWDKISKRYDKGNTPYNLRNCAYWKEFEEPKIIYNDISQKLSFVWDKGGYYFNNTAYFLYGNECTKYLLGVLNCSLIDWYYRTLSAQLGEKAVRMFSIYVENIPIIKTPDSEKITQIVNKIIEIKSKDNKTDTSDFEKEIDLIVYTLYGLSEKEIKVIEN